MAEVEASATADMFVTSIAKALGAPIRDVEREVVRTVATKNEKSVPRSVA